MRFNRRASTFTLRGAVQYVHLRRRSVVSIVLLTLLGMVLTGVSYWYPRAPRLDTSYRDATKSTNERVSILLAQMTLEEKLGQMALVEKNSVHRIEDVAEYALGAILSGGGGKPENNTPEGWRGMTDAFHSAAKKSRLGIPIFYGVDANHGHGNVPGATIFPHQIGLGATGDAALLYAIAQATAREMQATGVNWNYAPSFDLPVDIRWGRVYESFGDDPDTAGLLGTAFISGLQGSSSSDDYVLATAKHYVGVGSMQWGTSMNEKFSIDQGVTPADEDALRSYYLPPFRRAVEGGVNCVMAGLNMWGNTPVSASRYLLTDILKNELHFQGFVVSDWYGVYEIHDNAYDAVVSGVNAGIDMVMLPFDYKTFVHDMKRAVTSGDIATERIDDAVRRILRAKFMAGLFDHAWDSATDLAVVGSAPHRAIAHRAVADSLVLLKHDGTVLPLRSDTERVLVAGSGADNAGRQMGAWTVEWQGIDGNWLTGASTILDGIRAHVAPATEVMYELRGVFPKSVRATVGVVVASEEPYAEGWGDSALPALSVDDLAAIEHMRMHVDTVVVIILSGRPLIITGELAKWDVLIAGWLPGSEGAAVADVLFGARPFTGTLPMSWPRSLGQLPMNMGGEGADGTAPLFPRGYGLR